MENRLVKYLRDGDKLIGAVVGLPDGSIGVSLCFAGNTKLPPDHFNKVRAVELASQRARNSVPVIVPRRFVLTKLPGEDNTCYYAFQHLDSVVSREVENMRFRVKKYFRLQGENATNAVGNRRDIGTRLKTALNLFGF